MLSTVIAKVSLGFSTIFGAILAQGAVSDDRTLIILAIVTGCTTIIVSVVSAVVSVLNSRKLSKVEHLPQAVQQLEIKLDGRLQELMDSKEKAAYSAGGEQERVDERSRRGDEAIGAKSTEPTPVVMKNTTEDPAIVKPIE